MCCASRARRVLQQPRLERRIDPGARDDLCAAAGTDPALIGVHPGVDRSGIHQSLVDQQALQRLGAQSGIRRHLAARMIVRMVVVMRMIGQRYGHGNLGVDRAIIGRNCDPRHAPRA
jgi:hypothetical protein